MKLFDCQYCGQILFFENRLCEACGHVLGYLPEKASLSALIAEPDGRWRPMAAPERRQRLCANDRFEACNWLVPDDGGEEYCAACTLNRTVPDLSDGGRLRHWQKLEMAKRRLIYSLLRLGLPLVTRREDPRSGLAFDFLAAGAGKGAVTTGHAAGVITIDLAEADDAAREYRRGSFAEPYRTLLGHFRHEIGHYYWQLLVVPSWLLKPFRTLFGDERDDYGARLQAYHAAGPAPGWRSQFISAYASAHPWEDWAETWAHYLHILDTLETAYAFRMTMQPAAVRDGALTAAIESDPYDQADFNELLRIWLPLIYTVNCLNRSMGQPDLYPFVLAPAVIEKLRFVHALLRGREVEA